MTVSHTNHDEIYSILGYFLWKYVYLIFVVTDDKTDLMRGKEDDVPCVGTCTSYEHAHIFQSYIWLS